jgi:hypothetical protein
MTHSKQFVISFIATLLFSLTVLFAEGQAAALDCEKFKTGKFVYPELNNKYSLRTATTQESYNNGKLELVWNIVWFSACEYEITCSKVLVANSPFTPGDRIHATILETNGNCYKVATTVYTKQTPDGLVNVEAVMCGGN